MIWKLFKKEILYGIYSKTYLYITLFLVSLFVLVSYINYTAVTTTYNDFLHTKQFYVEQGIDIEEELEGEYLIIQEEGQNIIDNPLLYERELVSQYLYTANPKYVINQFLESAFLYFPIVFGIMGLLLAHYDYKYKTIKIKTVRANRLSYTLAKQISLLFSGLIILILALIIAHPINYLFYQQLKEVLPISEFKTPLLIENKSSPFIAKFMFSYLIAIIFMIIGFTFGTIFKNIYVGFIFIVMYTFILPNVTIFELKNSLHYLGNKVYDFYGVLSIENALEGTTIFSSISILIITIFLPIIINIVLMMIRSSFET